MPKISMPKAAPALDMTPMVDLAFLLVTFFMLTASVRVSEPVIVDTPSSVAEKLLPEKVLVITIDDKGRPFFNINNPQVRMKVLERMGAQYKIGFSDKEKKRFAGMTSFGVPMTMLKDYINKEDVDRLKVKSPGIPTDSVHNELGDWIQFGRLEEQRNMLEQRTKADKLGRPFKREPLRFAIKADGEANYIAVKEVIKVFTDKDIYRFNLITNLEQAETKK